MGLILLALVITCMGIFGWGFNSVLTELARRNPLEPWDSVARSFEVDPFIWSGGAPPWLRRRYILTMACGPLALLGLALPVWTVETQPDRRVIGGAGFCAIAALTATVLVWRVLRHRR